MIDFSFDTETYAFGPGVAAPKIVCGSWSNETETRLILREDALAWFKARLMEGCRLGGAHFFYDLGVCSAADPETFIPLIFEALDQGRLFCSHILEALHDNARGMFFRADNGAPIKRYSQGLLEERYLGVDRTEEKKGANSWRLRYGELDGVPLDDWPLDAKQYPLNDARGIFRVLKVQLTPGHEEPRDCWTLGLTEPVCEHCSKPRAEWAPGSCKPVMVGARFNLQCVADEMRSAWFLHLCSIWGTRTDPIMVPEVVAEITAEHEESRRQFFAAGIVRVRACVKKKDEKTGLSEPEVADDISRAWLDEAEGLLPPPGVEWADRRRLDIAKARKTLDKGKGIRFATDKARLAELVTAAYLGSPPETDGGGVSTARDTLGESGDPLLEDYGESGENEKLFSTYVSVLNQGTQVPINPEANAIVATQRTSYREPNLQQLPRGKKPGVGAARIRECFVPRTLVTFVDVPDDYTLQPGEEWAE